MLIIVPPNSKIAPKWENDKNEPRKANCSSNWERAPARGAGSLQCIKKKKLLYCHWRNRCCNHILTNLCDSWLSQNCNNIKYMPQNFFRKDFSNSRKQRKYMVAGDYILQRMGTLYQELNAIFTYYVALSTIAKLNLK